MASSLKSRKEAFVSDLEGTSMLEVWALSTLVPLLVVLRKTIGCILDHRANQPRHTPTQKNLPQNWLREWVLDFFFIILPSVASFSILSEHVYSFLCIVTLTLGLTYIYFYKYLSIPPMSDPHSLVSGKHHFVSLYRATVLLSTCIAILAVDFFVFPRRFAKVETYGTGLMDGGVGSFVFANALVSRQARKDTPSSVVSSLKTTAPLLVLGFARLVITKGVDYQEHVGEYGVHWNFFFTLAAVSILTQLTPIPPSQSGWAGGIILIVHQTALSLGGGSAFLSSPIRGPDFITLNKEGVLSVAGYWSLYLLTLQLGRYLLHPTSGLQAKGGGRGGGKMDRWRGAGHLLALTILLWGATVLSDAFVERTARRMCNLTYVMWMLAWNVQILFIFLSASLALPFSHVHVLEAFDRNMLPCFLVANILTGVVNMSIDTLAMSHWGGSVIIAGYMGVVSGIAIVLHSHNVTLKFW